MIRVIMDAKDSEKFINVVSIDVVREYQDLLCLFELINVITDSDYKKNFSFGKKSGMLNFN